TINVTALTAHHGRSVFECWALVPGFATSNQTGTAGAQKLELGNVANASYSILPPNFDGGLHNAPAIQFVAFLSGVAHITLPESDEEAYVVGGSHGLIIAADVAAVSRKGHITRYPTTEYTRALQIPTYGGKVPSHKVVHKGPCTAEES
ncbi:hypothetical protein BKA62DRAFT_589910, partial [Auriculariales sp. MPI-PUGE-AT-0066]